MNWTTKSVLSMYRNIRFRIQDQFLGFVCGICSQDYDLQEIYLDGFLKISGLEGKDISDALKQLNKISEQFKVNMILSVSMNEEDLPEFARSQVI